MVKNFNLTIVVVTLLCLAQSNMAQAQPKKSAGGVAEHANKGVELAQGGAYEEAIEEFTKAIKISPEDARLYNDRGRVYHRMNRLLEAIEDFSTAIKLAPKDYAGYSERGAAQVSQNQMDAAIADLNKALELKPDDAQTLRFRASAYKGLKQYDLAVADYTAILSKTDPNSSDQAKLAAADLLAKRGYTYNLMQQYENAINDFKEAMRLNPNDPDTPQRLDYSESMLAKQKATPTPMTPTATPSPTPEEPGLISSLITPFNIGIAIAVLIIIAVIVRLITRGKEEPTSSRIR
jgi:tetratricopeptide (TPR) repeat protein